MSVYDLNRLDVKKGRIILETDIYRSRFRMARLNVYLKSSPIR